MTNRTNPIPDGVHTVTPHLIVKGASEAIDFYKKAFGAHEIMRMPWPDLYVDDVDKTFNAALAAGAEVRMPVADMFWGDRYGSLVDPFGHEWSVATHIEDLSPEEIGKRAKVACHQR
jgi:PhnB protein